MAVVVAAAIVVAALAALLLLVRGPAVIRTPDGFENRPVSAERLEADVRTLCSDLSPRGYSNTANLDRTADWIVERFRQSDLEVTEQPYRVTEGEYRNVIGARPGTDPDRGVVIVGAHYDAYGELPGADDNASGVAVLLELAGTLPDRAPKRTQLFVAFCTEEPPFFSTPDMGSHHFARKLVDEGTGIDLMIALDLVGYFSDEAGSQRVPGALLRLAYPSRGDFIGVVGDVGAGRWIGRVKRGMRSAGALPVYSFRAPSFVPGVDWSDHIWFRRLGLPGVLVTDTAMMRNPNYHRSTDTPETLDYRRMAAVVQALHGVLQDE
jgi:Zn-dependent M28 family amino/carboxypeptidase